jgi:hypothetical protein
MNTDWQTLLIVTSACLTPILILSIIVAVRGKSFQAGFGLFLLFVGIATIGIAFIWLYSYIPVKVQRVLTAISFVVFILSVATIGVLSWIRSRRAGRILHQDKNAVLKMVLSTIWIVFTLIYSFLFIQRPITLSGAGFVLLLVTMSVVQNFLAKFEIRENGFISKGKVILYSDIGHAEWEDLFDKTRLKIRMKSTSQTVTIKTPWDFLVPIDDYIRKNFPR